MVINLTVNGREHQAPAGTTLEALLEQLQLCPENVVAVVNGEVTDHEHGFRTELHDGDNLELMTFVGGG